MTQLERRGHNSRSVRLSSKSRITCSKNGATKLTVFLMHENIFFFSSDIWRWEVLILAPIIYFSQFLIPEKKCFFLTERGKMRGEKLAINV